MSLEALLNANKTILLIDDNEIDLFINEKVIHAKKTGVRIIKESSATKAIESFQKDDSSWKIPDFIFIDLHMPLMSGFDFMTHFEKLPAERVGHCQIFMLTSSTHEQDIQKASEFKSIVRYLNKPLDLRELSGI